MRCLDTLRNGRPAELPVYDFTSHSRSKETEVVNPAEVILFEGILVLHMPEVIKRLNMKVCISQLFPDFSICSELLIMHEGIPFQLIQCAQSCGSCLRGILAVHMPEAIQRFNMKVCALPFSSSVPAHSMCPELLILFEGILVLHMPEVIKRALTGLQLSFQRVQRAARAVDPL